MVFEKEEIDLVVDAVDEELIKITGEHEKPDHKSDGFFLFFCVLIVNSFTFLTGCTISWTSPVLIKLYSNDSNINPLGEPITKFQESVVAGIPFLGSMVIPFFLSKLTHSFGRKNILAVFGGIQILSFVLLMLGANIWIYYLARFLVGIGYGVTVPLTAIYVTEIAPAHSRGRYGSMIAVFVPLGNLCSYAIGPMFSIRLFSFICALPCLIVYPFILWLLPDSPTSLAAKGKIEEATVILQKLRRTEDVKDELEDILYIAKKHQQDGKNKVNLRNLLNDRVSLAGLKIAAGIGSIQVFSGIIVIMAFVGPIFRTVNSNISGDTIAILFGLVKLISISFTAVVVERFRRRTLLLYSTTTSGISLFILGVYFYYKEVKHVQNIEQYSWIPIGCILLFVIFYATGLGPIAHIFAGEVFPGRFKAVAVSFMGIVSTMMAFLVTISFRFAVFYLGTHVLFWIFSLSCFLGIFFIYFKVPETRGKTLLEIQQMFDK